MRILLVQPDDARAAEMLAALDDAGHTARRVVHTSPDALRDAAPDVPDAVVIGLDAEPDRALDAVDDLVARRRMRGVPLLFAGGRQAGLTAAQERYPRANFARLDVLHTALASLRS